MYFIKLSKNKKKSDEQENIYLDERINGNREKSFALTFAFNSAIDSIKASIPLNFEV